MKTFRALLFSEMGQTFSTVILTSLIPVLLAQMDETGSFLSISSIASNLITIFLLPYLIKKTKNTSAFNYMLYIRISLILSCFSLILIQSEFLLIALHAALILLLSLQHANRNHLLITFAGGIKPSNLFKFEIGDSVVVFIAALTLFLLSDITESTIRQILNMNIVLITTMTVVLFINKRTVCGHSISPENESTNNVLLNNSNNTDKLSLGIEAKLVFARVNIGFLFQRLLWFIAPLWFVHHERVYDFFGWLLISGLGTLLAAILLKYYIRNKQSYYFLFMLCNTLIIICLLIMLFHTSFFTICLSGIVASLASPIHRSYARVLAESSQYSNISSAVLLGQGMLTIRALHLVLMVVFPFTLSYRNFELPIIISLVAILILINANSLHTKYRSIFQ
jgi:hypothetical protein